MAQERRHQHSQRVVQLQPAARPPQARQGSLPPSPAPEGTRCGQACLWARAALQAGGERSHSLHGTDCCIKRVPHATGFQEAARPHTQGRAGQAPRGPDGARGHWPAEGAVAKQASAPFPETPGKVPPAPAAQRPGGGLPGAPESRACGAPRRGQRRAGRRGPARPLAAGSVPHPPRRRGGGGGRAPRAGAARGRGRGRGGRLRRGGGGRGLAPRGWGGRVPPRSPALTCGRAVLLPNAQAPPAAPRMRFEEGCAARS